MSIIIRFQLVLLLTYFVVSLKLEDKSYNDLAKSHGLYGSDTKIIVLNVTNFKKSVYGTSNAWLVEFYNSWCGACQRFAPMWSNLAADVHDWRDVIKIAALDCADDDNNPFCREYEIMHYPSLRFFSANSKVGILGTEVEKGKTEEDIRHNLVHFLKKEQLEGRGSNWPNIIPYRSNDVLNLWKNVPESTRFAFLIFEEKESYLGTEVILDLHSIKNIQIRRVINENEALCKLMGVFTFPSLVVLERSQNVFPLKVEENSRVLFCKQIKSFLQEHKVLLPENIGNPIAYSSSTKSIVSTKQREHFENAVEQFGLVFQVDLENTIQYSLKSEIPVRKFISGHPLEALKKYLSVLVKYFPTYARGRMFLEKLKFKVQDLSTLKGQIFLEIVESLEAEMKPVFSNSDGWLGCKGSEKRYRGYPCGLWITFHTLTTNAVIENGNDPNFNSLEVLEAMLGYITHFFGCQECSRHFQEMAEKSMRQNVTSPEQSVLWLWSAHNMVNKRLVADLSEDPQHPKVQFPTEKACPACRGPDGRWITEQVLAYLKQMYSRHSIVHVGVMENQRVENVAKADTLHVQAKLVGTDMNYKIGMIDKKRLGWNFNIFDISLCVVLYAGSAVILILVFIKFIVRKRYRKKAYIHDLLGKV
ncbi:Sulfhydryl oxidase [Gryllus bimaculatus]|nr:Sulfhydryl oxidase [Gryllus bimaculatus]